MATRVVRLDRDRLSDGQAIHPGAQGENRSDELMAHHARVLHRPITGPDPVVRAAQAGSGDADDNLTGLRLETGASLDLQLTGTTEDGGDHHRYPSKLGQEADIAPGARAASVVALCGRVTAVEEQRLPRHEI